MLLADQWMPEITGSQLLGDAWELRPQAKRGLLVDWGAWGDRDAEKRLPPRRLRTPGRRSLNAVAADSCCRAHECDSPRGRSGRPASGRKDAGHPHWPRVPLVPLLGCAAPGSGHVQGAH